MKSWEELTDLQQRMIVALCEFSGREADIARGLWESGGITMEDEDTNPKVYLKFLKSESHVIKKDRKFVNIRNGKETGSRIIEKIKIPQKFSL